MAIEAHDFVSTSPTNTFATLNPLREGTQNLADGNLKISAESENHWSTIGVDPNDTNKYYFEMLVITQKTSEQLVGVSNQSGSKTNYLGSDANGWGIAFQSNSNNGDLSNNGLTASGVTFSANDIIQVCFTATKIWFGKNGTFIGNPSTESSPSFSNLSGTLNALITNRYVSGGSTCVNFGQDSSFGGATGLPTAPSGSPFTDANGIGSFYYSPPTGALALCTANLPEMTPNVDDDTPQDYFKSVSYVGNGPATAAPSDRFNINHGLSFTPDLMWFKSRSDSHWHVLFDSVRGEYSSALGYDVLSSNTTYGGHAVNSWSANYRLYSVDDSKFVFNNGVTTNDQNKNYVAWCWKAGGAPTADNSNTSGAMTANSVSLNGTLQSNYTPAGSPTIYPTRMSINTDAGFSIVKWSGNSTSNATLPTGLTDNVEFLIIKNLDASTSWFVSMPDFNTELYLNTTGNNFYPYYNISNTNNLITFGTSSNITVNNSGNYIAYCWHSVEGFSKIGSYTGNGSTDGPFVECGFRVGWLMVKGIEANNAHAWKVWNNASDPYNLSVKPLWPNLSNSEPSGLTMGIDFLSNGFKIRSNDAVENAAYKYIFMAFAEQPFKYANAR